jgi:hypothetical protein
MMAWFRLMEVVAVVVVHPIWINHKLQFQSMYFIHQTPMPIGGAGGGTPPMGLPAANGAGLRG